MTATDLDKAVAEYLGKINEYLVALNDVVADLQAESEQLLKELKQL